MASSLSSSALPGSRTLLAACVLCLCAWHQSPWPCGAAAFAGQSLLPQRNSCSFNLLGKHSTRFGPANRRGVAACSMESEGSRGNGAPRYASGRRRPMSPKSKFVVYTGPRSEGRDRELTAVQQEKKAKEIALGTKIQRSVRLKKLKERMLEHVGPDGQHAVTESAWAQAAGETVESLRAMLDEGTSAKQALVVLNLGMVHNIVDGYMRSMKSAGGSGGGGSVEFSRTDLVQEATMGLICAVDRFDPLRGFRFATYAQWWVRKYLNECLQNDNRMIRIPVTLAYRISKVNRIRVQLEKDLGRTPTRSELAVEAGFTLEQINTCIEQSALSVSSLDHLSAFGRSPSGVDDGPRQQGFLNQVDLFAPAASAGSPGEPQGAEIMQMSLREDLKEALFRLLDATERECLVLRYGLQDGVPKSVEETSEIMEFCEADDVRIVTSQAMAKLRDGCRPAEKNKLMSYLSMYEPDTLRGSKADENRRLNPAAAGGVSRVMRQANGDTPDSNADDDYVEDEEDEEKIYDFSNHGHEELEQELERYLKKLRKEKQQQEEEEKEGTKWSKRALAKQQTGARRKTRKSSASDRKALADAARRREERQRKLKRERDLKRREREQEAEWERQRLLRPIPIGSGAGSAVIGDLEPKPNSREATQLEHLSRLLWDGEEEPADFALTYGLSSERSAARRSSTQ